tara:strand:+ start:139 stop:273 length:135 start_codon:yes stop_codon:yes gene_type:complete
MLEFRCIIGIDQASYKSMKEKSKIIYMGNSIKIVFSCYENFNST